MSCSTINNTKNMNNADKRSFTTTRMLKHFLYDKTSKEKPEQHICLLYLYICLLYLYMCVGVYIISVIRMEVCMARTCVYVYLPSI